MCLLFEVHARYETALAACDKAVQENGAQEIRPARNVFRLGHERVLFHRDRFKQTIHPKGSAVTTGSPLLLPTQQDSFSQAQGSSITALCSGSGSGESFRTATEESGR